MLVYLHSTYLAKVKMLKWPRNIFQKLFNQIKKEKNFVVLVTFFHAFISFN